MRIRRSASRLLGYSAPAAEPAAEPLLEVQLQLPPPLRLAPCSAPESQAAGGVATASGEPCELSRSPWDLIAELSLSDPQVEDDLVDRYFVNVACRASWLFAASMPASSSSARTGEPATADGDCAQPRHEAAKKAPKKLAMGKEKGKVGAEPKKKPKVKKEEEVVVAQPAPVWKCKKNIGKRWQCHRTVSLPNSLCDYHYYQKHRYSGGPSMGSVPEVPASPVSAATSNSKAPASSKPWKKKRLSHNAGASEGYYYYAGFGPFRSKRHCRSSMQHDSVPAKQEDEEDEPPEDASPPNQAQAQVDAHPNRAATHYDESGWDEDIAGIAGVDEESSDEDFGHGPIYGSSDDPRVSSNGDAKMKNNNPWKRWRKPVKARSLKSLM